MENETYSPERRGEDVNALYRHVLGHDLTEQERAATYNIFEGDINESLGKVTGYINGTPDTEVEIMLASVGTNISSPVIIIGDSEKRLFIIVEPQGPVLQDRSSTM